MDRDLFWHRCAVGNNEARLGEYDAMYKFAHSPGAGLETLDLAFLLGSAEVEGLLQRSAAEKNSLQKIRDMFLLFFGVIGGSTSYVLVQRALL